MVLILLLMPAQCAERRFDKASCFQIFPCKDSSSCNQPHEETYFKPLMGVPYFGLELILLQELLTRLKTIGLFDGENTRWSVSPPEDIRSLSILNYSSIDFMFPGTKINFYQDGYVYVGGLPLSPFTWDQLILPHVINNLILGRSLSLKNWLEGSLILKDIHLFPGVCPKPS